MTRFVTTTTGAESAHNLGRGTGALEPMVAPNQFLTTFFLGHLSGSRSIAAEPGYLHFPFQGSVATHLAPSGLSHVRNGEGA